ncbi:hypothetical protein BVX98_02210, partial [bacterium F11]
NCLFDFLLHRGTNTLVIFIWKEKASLGEVQKGSFNKRANSARTKHLDWCPVLDCCHLHLL